MSENRLIALMHRVAKQSRKSIEEQCDDIYGPGMKSHWTYRKELNPAEEYARFPVEKLAAFCRSTENVEALELIADELGYNLSKRKARNEERFTPVAIFSAATRLAEMEQDQTISRLELSQAVNAVIDEAEAILYRRYPQSVAFSLRSRVPEGGLFSGFWNWLRG